MLRKRGHKLLALPLIAALTLFLSGCAYQAESASYNWGELFSRGFLPGGESVTNHTDRIAGLWTTSWIVLWGVGLIAWGLMFWAIFVYRRRKGDTGLPPQLRYNMPIETLFTVIPFILVIGFFAFTARDMAEIEKVNPNPDVKISVIAKQWSWDFNYVNADVYETGVQSRFEGELGSEEALPTLYLPVGKSVEIELSARDVIHSFWVIDFLYKKDMFPGKSNFMYFTPLKEGSYKGKCAELCGEFHSMMLFNVEVVSQAEFDTQMAALAAKGQIGQLDKTYDRNQNLPGDDPSIRD